MNYEPRGKVKLLADAMAAEPGRIWTSPEVARVMDVHQGALTAHLDTAVRHGAIFRKLEGGRCQYSLKPFLVEAAGPIAVPKFITGAHYVPPKMTAPRPGSDVPHVSPPPTPAPPAPPTVSDPEEQHAEQQLEGDVDAAVEFNACAWADGDVTIYGAQENEDGSFTLKRDQVVVLRRLVAWMPA